MKNKFIAIMLIPFLLFIYPMHSFAEADIYSFNGSALINPPKYYPQYDKYMASFDKDVVVHIVHRLYSDSSYTDMRQEFNLYSPRDNGDVFAGVMNWNCKVYYENIFYDRNNKQVGYIRFYPSDIQNPKCTSGAFPEDDEDKSHFQDYINNGGLECDQCKVFNCPGWNEYMGKMDEILNKIPPAPNWDSVANKFKDSIVPKVINDLKDMLGTAPNEPETPSQPSGVDLHGIESKTPNMKEIEGLNESQFDENKIKNEAPVIKENQDESGGFDLLKNPIDSLPDLPSDEFPEPGNSNAGEWLHTPTESDNPFPKNPKDTGSPIMDNPPIPKSDNDTAPIPDDNNGNVPIPDDEDDLDDVNYKKHPDDPDGSG